MCMAKYWQILEIGFYREITVCLHLRVQCQIAHALTGAVALAFLRYGGRDMSVLFGLADTLTQPNLLW